MRERTHAALWRLLRDAARLVLVLDYDGTLVPIVTDPRLASPDDALRALLAALAQRPDTEVHVVSGRPRDVLDGWLSGLPVWLWAEHGAFRRGPGHLSWQPLVTIPAGWMDEVRPVMEQARAATPGSQLEPKSASIAWHYRNAPAGVAEKHVRLLRVRLAAAISRGAVDLVEGRKVMEVRPHGVSKAIVAGHLRADLPGTAIVAVGDDRTDEDLFGALPPSSIRVAVGRQRRCAEFVLPDYRAVRELLRTLLV